MLITDSYNDILRIFNQVPEGSDRLLEAYNSLLNPITKLHSPPLREDSIYQQFSHQQLLSQLPFLSQLQTPFFQPQQQQFNLQQQFLMPQQHFTQQQQQLHQQVPQGNNLNGCINNKPTTKRTSPTSNEVKDIFSMADMFQVTEACGGSNGFSYSSPKMHSKNGGIGRKKINYFLKFGEYGTGPGQFTEPSGVCSNEAGEFLVADTNNHRIQIFNHEGEFLRQIGDGQKTDGPLVYPNRVAVCPKTSNIIVTERPPSKQVQVFTSDGAFVRRFGSNIIMHPRGLAVDQDGKIIVLESKVMRTLIYDEFGTLEHNFECPDINFANSVAVNNHQEIFITDNRSHCVKVFDYVGNMLRQIGGDGITNFPIGVNIGPNGEVLVADNHNNFNVTIFDREGNLISAVESKVKHAQCFDVTLTSDGSVVVASKDYRLYVYRFPLELFSRSGAVSRMSRSTVSSPHVSNHSLFTNANAQASINNVLLNGTHLNGALNYSNPLNNLNLASFSSSEESKRLFDTYNMLTSNLNILQPPITPFLPTNSIPNGLQINNKIPSNKRISPTCSEVKDIFSTADMFQVTEDCGIRNITTPKSTHSSNGGIRRKKINYFLKFGEYGTGPGQFTEPSGVCSNEAGEFLVADTNNHRIQIFNHEGEFLRQIGDHDGGDQHKGEKEPKHDVYKGDLGKDDKGRSDGVKHKGLLVYPNRVAVCPKTGNIIVTERPPSKQVQVFTADGKFVRRFGSNVIMHPRGLTVDKNGKIIVLESKVMRTLIHDEFGILENSFDCPEVNFANSIAVNDFNEIFITDNRYHCVKVFDYNGNRLREIGGEGITNFPIGVNIGPNGEVLVADNHNNFNVTIFDREGNLISAVESKVKHAQCFDVTLTSDGSVVVASKDYRLYVYRFPLELFSRSGTASRISRSTSSSPPLVSFNSSVPSYFPNSFLPSLGSNGVEQDQNGVSRGFVGLGRKKSNDSGYPSETSEYQQFPNFTYHQNGQQNGYSRPIQKQSRMITNNNLNGDHSKPLAAASLNRDSTSASPYNGLFPDLNDVPLQNNDMNGRIGMFNIDNYLYNNCNNSHSPNNNNNSRPSTALPHQQFENNNYMPPSQSLLDNLINHNNNNKSIYNNHSSNYNNINKTTQQNQSHSNNFQHYLNQSNLFNNNDNDSNLPSHNFNSHHPPLSNGDIFNLPFSYKGLID